MSKILPAVAAAELARRSLPKDNPMRLEGRQWAIAQGVFSLGTPELKAIVAEAEKKSRKAQVKAQAPAKPAPAAPKPAPAAPKGRKPADPVKAMRAKLATIQGHDAGTAAWWTAYKATRNQSLAQLQATYDRALKAGA